MNYFSKALKLAGFLCVMIIGAQDSFAQQPAKTPPPPLPSREISGIVKDSTDLGVIGATVSLTSDQDTLKTSTNNDGIFVFKNVKSATYTIVVQSIGYVKTPPMRFKQNDLVPRIVMDPILLKEEKNTLNTVVINGTPSITYKTDTVEYKASDYVVRKNATVDELLKKMEGMEVGLDGTLIHNGENVVRAKLNGKEYLGGSIASAIKNLPAEIVEKIQIVDDYGDQAARTGVKDGDPQKILNITTREDKSVGNTVRLRGSGGSNDRVNGGLFATRINKNQQIGLEGEYRKSVNGVGGGSLGGNTKNGEGKFSIRDKMGKAIEYNLNYSMQDNRSNDLSESISLFNSTLGQLLTQRSGTGLNNSKRHEFKLETEINLDSNDFLRVVPSFNYNSSSSNNTSTSIQRGQDRADQDQDRTTENSSSNTRPQLGLSVFYQHRFDKYRRNFSMQADINRNNQDDDRQQYQRTLFYSADPAKEDLDSIANRIIARKNLQNNYRGSLTYVEPLGTNTQLEFNAQVNYNGYDNTATTRNVTPSGLSQVIDSLSNIYAYSFTQGRIALNFRYGMSNTSRVRLSAGLTAVPALLEGTKVSLGTTTRRSSFNMIPIARFEYIWSRQQKASINYSGNAQEPSFDQIQPVRDVSTPTNPVVGNPNLAATFVHNIRAQYNNYISNSKLNITLTGNLSFTDNAVIRNVVETRDFSNPDFPVRINETRFVNVDGVYRTDAQYNVSKQINNRKYTVQLDGRVRFNHDLVMSNNEINERNTISMEQRFGPRINPTEWFEMSPNIGYNHTRTENSIARFINNKVNTLSFNVEGRVIAWQTWLLNYNASKRFVRGITGNTNNNPFIVNARLEKELFDRRGTISFEAFDLLNQNNLINRDQNDFGYTETRSNPNSRYFMLNLNVRLQKWTGAKSRDGKGIRRRGDGSFM